MGLKELTIKQLKMNKRRTLVTIIAIVLTSTLLFAIGISASTSRQIAINNAINQSGKYHVLFNNLPYSKYEILKNNKTIKDINYYQDVERIIKDTVDNNYYDQISIDIVNVDPTFKSHLNLDKGIFPTGDNEIIISNELIKDLDYKIGDFLNNYKIVGTYTYRNDNSISVASYYVNSNYTSVGSSYAYIVKNVDENSPISYMVLFKSLNNIYEKIYNTADSLSLNYNTDYGTKRYDNTSINYSLLSAYGKYDDQNVQDGIEMTLMLILTILAMFCIIIIYNSFSISLSERKKYIGILRSVGASKKQIFKSVLYETFAVSIIGIPIGLLLSLIVMGFVLLVINGLLSSIILVPYSLAIYPIYILISLFFIIITIFISALFPTIKATNFSPIVSIRKNLDYEVDYSRENNKIIRKILGAEGEYAYKNIKRNASKYIVTTFSLGISIVLFIVISTYVHLAFTYAYDNVVNYDIIINVPKTDEQEEIINKIKNIEYIDEIVENKTMYLYFKNTDKTIFTDEYQKYNNSTFDLISVIGLDQKNYNKYLKKLKISNDNSMIIYNMATYYPTNAVAYEEEIYNIFKDEDITLNICDVNPENFLSKTIDDKNCYLKLNDFYITNTAFDYENIGPIIYVNMDKYEEIAETFSQYTDYNSYKTINLEINSKNFKQFDEAINPMIAEYGNDSIYYNNSAMNNYENHMNNVVTKFILYSVIAFITVIAVTTIYNIISTNMLLREVEFAVLKSIGLSNKGMNKIIILESLFLSFETLIYAIPFSLIVIYYISYSFKIITSNKDIATIFPTQYIIIAIIATIIINLIIMLLSSKKIQKRNIIEAIRNENI